MFSLEGDDLRIKKRDGLDRNKNITHYRKFQVGAAWLKRMNKIYFKLFTTLCSNS